MQAQVEVEGHSYVMHKLLTNPFNGQIKAIRATHYRYYLEYVYIYHPQLK